MNQRLKIDTEESLMLMRVIDTNPQMTQRELSSHLGLSLGKINFLMKAMIEKGFVKANNFKNSNNKIAYLYYLTPRGIEEKAKITYRFLKLKLAEYERLEEEIRQLEQEVNSKQFPVK
jgi:EPS-associated MarR family transcriptional regulator